MRCFEGRQNVINARAIVRRPGTRLRAPTRVCTLFLGMQNTKMIDQHCVQKIREPYSRGTGVKFHQWTWFAVVDCAMRNVDVTG